MNEKVKDQQSEDGRTATPNKSRSIINCVTAVENGIRSTNVDYYGDDSICFTTGLHRCCVCVCCSDCYPHCCSAALTSPHACPGTLFACLLLSTKAQMQRPSGDPFQVSGCTMRRMSDTVNAKQTAQC